MIELKVEVVEYNKEWPILYEIEAEKIRNILKDELVNIYHIGSTSVQNLRAKPIIDIMPVVRDISRVDNYNKDFEALGYEPKGEFGITGRRYFRKGIEIRTHQIHIFEEGNLRDIERHLAVRDYLRTHPQDSFEYGKLKSRLADMFPEDIEAYCDGKDAFVKELERKALEWYQLMNYKILDLNDIQSDDIDKRLYEYDKRHITYELSGNIKIGVVIDDKLIAGADACMTAFRILYVSTLFVDESYRNRKIGTLLMKEIERRAEELGANMIRLDTFNWQGRDFYRSLGYEEVGSYENKIDGFSEHFFLKRL